MSGADQEPRRWRTEENDAEGNGKGGKEEKGLSVVLSAKCTCIYDNTFDTNKYKLFALPGCSPHTVFAFCPCCKTATLRAMDSNGKKQKKRGTVRL